VPVPALQSKPSPARRAGLGFAGLAALGAATVAYAAGIERLAFTLRRVDAAVLPAGSAPVRVLHLSDFHLAPWQRRKIAFIRSLAELEPDLVIDTGDNLGHRDGVPAVAEALAPFRGVPGVSVYGSNDFYGPVFKNPLGYLMKRRRVTHSAEALDTDALSRLLDDDLGWHRIDNDAVVLDVAGSRLRFIGVADPHIKRDRLPEALEALGRVSDAAGSWDATVGVVHAPYQRILDPLADVVGADVVFAGHTHGGQVCVPGYGALTTNCDLPREQVKGLSTWRSRGHESALHVSAGLGTAITAPVRFACPPEATLVTLTARSR